MSAPLCGLSALSLWSYQGPPGTLNILSLITSGALRRSQHLESDHISASVRSQRLEFFSSQSPAHLNLWDQVHKEQRQRSECKRAPGAGDWEYASGYKKLKLNKESLPGRVRLVTSQDEPTQTADQPCEELGELNDLLQQRACALRE
ncbi:hypothetical protein NDU88_000617 [Pleurodeles waltl]|uniref:Uncharacterized protein n=1 Tax=Pleurodeles waltl TaxID=8319 RepID=A0AAV7P8S0_PLEWA|nr:hypothetical protein NDU88_000617 [Pleurodeles waltl]